MAAFDIKAVEPLDFDFTGWKKNTGSGYCTGKGTIPEPTQAHLDAFAEGMKNMVGKSKDEKITPEDTANLIDKTIEEAGAETESEKNKALEKKVIKMIAGLCQNSPSEAQLAQLPPRIRTAFMKWVHRQLADPKVMSDGTRS